MHTVNTTLFGCRLRHSLRGTVAKRCNVVAAVLSATAIGNYSLINYSRRPLHDIRRKKDETRKKEREVKPVELVFSWAVYRISYLEPLFDISIPCAHIINTRARLISEYLRKQVFARRVAKVTRKSGLSRRWGKKNGREKDERRANLKLKWAAKLLRNHR